MKFLITGGNGMLAFALKDVIGKRPGVELFSCDKDECDIADGASVERVFKKFQPDFVLNCAAYTAVDKAEQEKEIAMAVNAEGTANLAKACAKSNVILVHFSTDYVFNGSKKSYDEDDARDPINAYGLSKAGGEEYIEKILANGKYYIIRTAWLYGPHGPNFVETMLKLAGEKDSLSVVNDQHGSPTLTCDLAEAVCELIKGGADQYPFGVYHLTNSGSCTWYEYTCKIFEYSGIKTPVRPVTSGEFPRPAKRPAYSILNNNKCSALRPWSAALKYYLTNLR